MRRVSWINATATARNGVSKRAGAGRTFQRIRSASLAVTILSAPAAASGAGLNQFIGFGDSTMDSGYFGRNPTGSPQLDAAIRITVAAGGSGAFAGPGEVDTTLLAARFGLNATPFIVTGGGGTNYANGAAQAVASFAINGQGLPNLRVRTSRSFFGSPCLSLTVANPRPE